MRLINGKIYNKIIQTCYKGAKKLLQAHILNNTEKLLTLISESPYIFLPPYEKLCGRLNGYYSRQINECHRLVYRVDGKSKTIFIIRMWTHYERT